MTNAARVSDRADGVALLRGLPVAIAAYLLACIGFGVVEIHAYPDRLQAWILANAINLGICGLLLWARARVRSAFQSKLLIILANLGIAAVITGYTILVHSSWRMLTTGLIILMAGTSLLSPLGAISQALISGGITGIYVAPLLGGLENGSLGLELVTLMSAAGVTIIGAYMSEYYQREVVAAREAARADAKVANTLIEIGHELNATLNRAEVLHRLARRAADVFGAPIGGINLIENGRLRIVEVSGLPEAEVEAARTLYFDLDSLPGAWELLRQPLIELPDVTAQQRFPPALLQQFGYSGLLIAPMRRGDRLLGAVSFMYREPRAPFTARERQLARGLAEQAALALENARLYEELQESAEIAVALLRVAEVLGSSLDPQKVAHDLAGLACELVRSSRAAVYRWEDGRWCSAAVHPPDVAQPANPGGVDDGSFAFFRELRRTGLVEIQNADTQSLLPPGLLQRFGGRSSLTALLARGANPLAMIAVAHDQRIGPFSERDKRIMSGLAHLGVVALTNAQLAEQLRSANRVKSEFVATMSHELRTPLNVILGYTDLLRDATLGPVQSAQADALDRIRERSLDLLQLVQATLDLNRLEAGVSVVDHSAITIHDFIDSVRAQIPAHWLKPSVQLEFRTDVPDLQLWSDSAKLHAVVRNLIHNALKFTATGTVECVIRRAAEPAQIILEVRDTGCGIPAEKTGEIFEMFVQGGTNAANDGVGLGLHLCRRFVTLLDGSIEVESRVGEGSTFRVRLPIGSKPSAPVAV